MNGNVQPQDRKATEGQMDELRNSVNRSFNKLRERLRFEVAEQWGRQSSSLDKVLERLLFSPPAVRYTKIISGAEMLALDATDGTETIAQTKGIFTGGIDGDFIRWGLDVPSQPTKGQNVSTLEMIKDGTFKQIYNGLSSNLDSLCLTQPQIIGFAKKHRKWLRTEGNDTFFLFRRDEEFFVARVDFRGAGSRSVRVDEFSSGSVWYAGFRHRVVVPQLEPSGP